VVIHGLAFETPRQAPNGFAGDDAASYAAAGLP
jgi:hypothetical protein